MHWTERLYDRIDVEVINRNTPLKKFIYRKNVIPTDLCDFLVSKISKENWSTHTWYDSTSDSFASESSNEPDVLSCTKQIQDYVTPIVNRCIVEYDQKFTYSKCDRAKNVVKKLSMIRFNRYEQDQMMRQHIDHIQSLFDGDQKGIPILSVVANLNDDYEGGHLYFWDNFTLKLKKGDVVIFPSTFMFPHGVKKISKGTRYSFVCWGW